MADQSETDAEEVEVRATEFMETFGGTEFFEEGFVKLSYTLFSLTEIMYGGEAAEKAFDLMLKDAFSHREGRWREILEDEYSGIYSETALGQLIHDLTAYADYGISLSNSPTQEKRYEELKEQIEAAERFLAMLPAELWDLRQEHMVRILRKAIARWKLDNDQDLIAEDLALLSRKALQTILNNLAQKGKPIVGNKNHIVAKEALAWLIMQSAFRPSILDYGEPLTMAKEEVVNLEEVVFVPVGSDGSVFHPGLKRDGFYRIAGPNGEEDIEEFILALTKLQARVVPTWRRPTPSGFWTQIRAVDWRRMTMTELTAEAAAQSA